MERVLLLGGSGILGSEVLLKLQSENFIYVSPTSLELDITNKDQILKFVSQFNPSWIVNCAAWTNVDGAESHFQESLQLNARAVQYIGEVAAEIKSRVIHISTDYVFDGNGSVPYLESDPTNPINAYGKSKLEGEKTLSSNLEIDSFVIRTSWLYGKNGKNFVKTIIRKALAQESCSVVGDQYGTPTYSRDLATGIVNLMKNPMSPGTYHYSNLGEASWYEFARAIYQLTGADPDLVSMSLTADINQQTPRPRYSVLSKEKWLETKVSGIPDWQTSLELAMPEILIAVRSEIA
jgi:dTDP-4-dehydrorhamnose reductase